jgi:hypothetical protein
MAISPPFDRLCPDIVQIIMVLISFRGGGKIKDVTPRAIEKNYKNIQAKTQGADNNIMMQVIEMN